MQIRHIGLLFLLLLLAVFAAANWATFVAPTDLNLLLGRVQAPFGLIMLGTVVIMGLVYSLLLLLGERRLLSDNSRLSRELVQLRDRDKGGQSLNAEATREIVAEELSPLRQQLDRILTQLAEVGQRGEGIMEGRPSDAQGHQ